MKPNKSPNSANKAPNNNKNKDFKRDILLNVFILLGIFFVFSLIAEPLSPYDKFTKDSSETKTYNSFLEMVDKKEVKEVTLFTDKPTIFFTNKKGILFMTDNPNKEEFKEFLLMKDISVKERIGEVKKDNSFSWIIIIFIIALIGFHFVKKRRDGTGKSKKDKIANLVVAPKIKFSDIAGHESVKKDVNYLLDFLKNPKKYEQVGARLPKGTILYGEPGTGKTLLAKAIAGEAGVPFFSISGSDFIEKYVGVGAQRVRELFSTAREHAPCIVFIDEIDAIGKKRGSNSNNESDQTINAILTELDGFNAMNQVVVIGATNRIEVLDNALIRPGRFDKHIAIPLPDLKERRAILDLHGTNKQFDTSVDFDELAKLTIGFSGAGLETLLNESAIISVGVKHEKITDEDIDNAFYKIVMKGDKKSLKEVSEQQKKLVAWHEAGHALLAKLLTNKSVPKTTIIPSTNGSGGVTFIVPNKLGLQTKRELENDVKVLYAGRIAEYFLTGDADEITTGASQDIKQSTKIILGMIHHYGMSDEYGMLDVETLGNRVSLDKVEDVAKKISKSLYKEAEELISKNKFLLEAIAEALMEKETIVEKELDEIIEEHRRRVVA